MPEQYQLPETKESTLLKIVKLLLKVAVTILCFWYISIKIDFTRALSALAEAQWWFLLIAVVLYSLSKLIAALRLNIYFRNINIRLSEWKNIRLYWLGMFYNLFLPGSISGDAYKVVLLNKRTNAPYKKTASAVLLDRFSGLLALGVLLSACGVVVLQNKTWDLVLAGAAGAAIVTLYLSVRFFFRDFLKGFWTTFFLGLIVQGLQVIAVYFILKSLHITAHEPQWIFIFLTAAVVSVLPISLGGGLGTREFVFVQGADFFHLDQHIAVIISLLFYLCSLLSHVWGFYFIFHDPLKEKN